MTGYPREPAGWQPPRQRVPSLRPDPRDSRGDDVWYPVSGRQQASTWPAQQSPEGGARWAMLAYLGVPFSCFLAPLAIYLLTLRGHRFVHQHATQALNVAITTLLYDLSAAIMAAMLSLDSPPAALAIAGTAVIALWAVALRYLVRAASAAGQGGQFRFPH
jgi:uncharacterized Tic20 family protein